MNTEQAGWVVATIGAVGTAIKVLFDYFKKRNDNDTKVKLSENVKEEQLKQELNSQHKELLKKIDELETKLDHTERQLEKATLAFDIILPLLQEILKERPEYRGMIDKAVQHLTPKN